MRPLIYALHSGNLYGTERMALATLSGLSNEFAPWLLAPNGPVIDEARRLGIPARAFSGARDFARQLQPLVAAHRNFAFVATGVVHSLACIALAGAYRRRVSHVHVVHGGTDERLSYGRKRLLNRLPVRFVAVSDFVRERLLAHRVRDERVAVIENFLPDTQVAGASRRPPFARAGVRRVAIVSRIDPIKRVDLALDALDRAPELAALEINVFGTGWSLDALRERAARSHPNVRFHGFRDDVGDRLAEHDLLLHLCPQEPFGLAVIEAMAAGLPVLVPDSGGAGSLVRPGDTGFHFRANDAHDLSNALKALSLTDADELNRVVARADAALCERFGERARLADYRRLLLENH
jgi:glycosyltransferase involved in cell wall biosynthesis